MSTINLAWPVVKRHAQGRIEDLRDMLERSDPASIPAIQASIKTWREVIDLPTTIMADDLEPPVSAYNPS
ncbi:hypothetical protein [Novosphingobium sp. FKTRR1]|uniref:hypothetical protein n=1 Tax=Novosphingobium sp. FKTRR1 TaxID=2879118 RepID=UPI001CEFF6F8|nr:hypothetical protein [Novosphingobium sp. FKTRR1]